MTLEVLVIAVVRILGSLPVLRWPLAGGILATLVDFSDLFIRDWIDLGGVPDYQTLDKALDQVYLACFLLVALRWTGVERRVAIGLYLYRLVGFVVFELSGDRGLLMLFPNVFEFWFLAIATLHRFGPGTTWTRGRLLAVLVVLVALKEAQEWALHVGRIFDGFGTQDLVRWILEWVTGGR